MKENCKPTSCEEFGLMISCSLDGELEFEEQAWLSEHLLCCGECRARQIRFGRIGSLINQSGEFPSERVEPEFGFRTLLNATDHLCRVSCDSINDLDVAGLATIQSRRAGSRKTTELLPIRLQKVRKPNLEQRAAGMGNIERAVTLPSRAVLNYIGLTISIG